jgi:tRNA 2-thiouridine synthesizing protein A
LPQPARSGYRDLPIATPVGPPPKLDAAGTGLSSLALCCKTVGDRTGSGTQSETGYGMQAAMSDETIVSLRGLKCPLPALKTRKLLSGLTSGDVLTIECTDPLAAIDIPNLLRETGDILENTETGDAVLTFRIRKR